MLHGTVTLANGSPAAGATITLRFAPGTGSSAERTTTTDAGGNFRLARVRAGVYWLTAQAGTAQSALITGLEVRENQETSVSVVLSEAGSISGSAVLEDRPTDGGVLVDIAGTPFNATSGADGAYELSGVPSGTFNVSFSAQGYSRFEAEGVEVTGGEATMLADVVLERIAPYASFTVIQSGNVVEVDGSASYDTRGEVVSYAWDFGDGTRVQGGPEVMALTHTYTRSGEFTISLRVTNDRGNSDVGRLTVTVALPQLVMGAAPTVWTLPAGSEAAWDVVVPGGVQGDVLYFDVEGAESIAVRSGASVYYSTEFGTFRRLAGGAQRMGDPVGNGSPPRLEPLAISVGRTCLGPCVLLPNTGGAVLTVHNPGPGARQVRIHLSAEGFDDLNEPNDQRMGATGLSLGTDAGAIELVGDVDWFRIAVSGRLTFDTAPGLPLRAALYGASGAPLTTLSSGVPVNVTAGDFVQVRAQQAEAAPSGVSTYYLSLE